MRHLFVVLILTLGLCSRAEAQPLHPSYPRWEAGCLDLLMLNTGRGDALLLTMPDGTRMLIDAGELDLEDPRTWSSRNTPAKPNGSRFAYDWIAHYINLLTPEGEAPGVDYALITHFHDDHYGLVYPGSRHSLRGDYFLSGITGVGDAVAIGRLVDRGYPRYDEPYDLAAYLAGHGAVKELETLQNYRRFIDYHVQQHGMKAEQFVVGSDTQFEPQRHAVAGFRVVNLYANGHLAQPEFEALFGDTLRGLANENNLSCALRIDYGAFRLFVGGDVSGLPDRASRSGESVESLLGPLVGPLDVAVANHHAGRDVLSEPFIAALAPRVWMQSVWSSDQPGSETLRRMLSRELYPGERDLFATNMLEANRTVIGSLIDQAYSSTEGHILLRVYPSGQYLIYILDSDRPDLGLKQTFGPYQARPKPAQASR